MDTITRKTLLYNSGVGVFCINHAQGCSHGCLYPCYSYMMAKSYGRVAAYGDWCKPKLVGNAEFLLKKELVRMKQKPDSIHLCLSTDPFMTGYPEVTDVSLKLVSIINSYGIPCSLLTKGMLPSELADRKRFPQRNMHGISIVSVNEDFRRKWEPGTAPYRERIAALRYLYDCGLETRAHIEPYPTPNIIRQNLIGILEAVEFVDHIFFSGWNYNNFVKEYPGYREFYLENTEIVKEFCIERGIEFSH